MADTTPTAHPGKQDWIGLPEAAALFGLSRYTLARAARDELLQTRRTGKIWLTTPAAVEAWLRAARHRPGPRPGQGVGRPRPSTKPADPPPITLTTAPT